MLKLEQAFDKNRYVVGAERKELAKHLNLSETQVRNKETNLAKKKQYYIRAIDDRVPAYLYRNYLKL